jgi:hypothetical protein
MAHLAASCPGLAQCNSQSGYAGLAFGIGLLLALLLFGGGKKKK